eukprot:symbB.v1.2.000880.t1/scaffold38.1/size396883/20
MANHYQASVAIDSAKLRQASPELLTLVSQTVRQEAIVKRGTQKLTKPIQSDLLWSFAVSGVFDLDFFSWALSQLDTGSEFCSDIRELIERGALRCAAAERELQLFARPRISPWRTCETPGTWFLSTKPARDGDVCSEHPRAQGCRNRDMPLPWETRT